MCLSLETLNQLLFYNVNLELIIVETLRIGSQYMIGIGSSDFSKGMSSARSEVTLSS